MSILISSENPWWELQMQINQYGHDFKQIWNPREIQEKWFQRSTKFRHNDQQTQNTFHYWRLTNEICKKELKDNRWNTAVHHREDINWGKRTTRYLTKSEKVHFYNFTILHNHIIEQPLLNLISLKYMRFTNKK